MNFDKSRNSSKLQEIQKESIEKTNGIVSINIPLDQIDENPENAAIFNMDHIEMLAKGIEQDGFMGAINVFQKDDGRYEISSGHRRYRAMKMLGRTTIPCIVSPMPSDTERSLKLLSSNIRNRELRPLDWARAIKKYKEIIKSDPAFEKKAARKQCAEFFGMAEGNIFRFEALLRLIPELQELANDPEFASSAFAPAAQLDKEEQKELYKKIRVEIGDGSDDKPASISRTRIFQLIEDVKRQRDDGSGNEGTEAELETEPGFLEDEALQQEDTPVEDNSSALEDSSEAFDALETEDLIPTEVSMSEEPASGIRTLDIHENDSTVDRNLGIYTEEIEKMTSGDIHIKDKTTIKKYIKLLQKAINILEKTLDELP